MDYSVSVFRFNELREYQLSYYRNSIFARKFFETVRDVCVTYGYPVPLRLEVKESVKEVKRNVGIFKKKEETDKFYTIDVWLHFNLTKEEDAKLVMAICESVFAGAQLRKP